MQKREFAKYFDHTLLRADATKADFEVFCADCAKYGFAMAAINPEPVRLCKELLKDSGVRVGAAVVLGKARRVVRSKNIRPGDKLIMTKQAGIEGAMILCADFPEKLESILTAEDRRLLEEMAEAISVVPEARIAERMGAAAMHDVTEGGILGAAYELAEAAGLGLRLNTGDIPVHPVARKVCAHLGLNAYRLISSGSLLIAHSGPAEPLLEALGAEGIMAAVIGEFTPGGIVDEEGRGIAPPTQDELYRVSR